MQAAAARPTIAYSSNCFTIAVLRHYTQCYLSPFKSRPVCRFASLSLLLGIGVSCYNSNFAADTHIIGTALNHSATMSKWKVEEPKTPDEDAVREEDLQYGTSGLTEEELAAKYVVERIVLRDKSLTLV
jgi:hypothetical protein